MTPPDLHAFRWIVINSSGGKDSQTALRVVVEAARAQGVPLERLVVSHQCLGRMEWPGTLALVRAQAAHYGLRFEVAAYRNKDQQPLTLLDYVRKRGQWPDANNRYCTSEFKRGPGGRVIVKLAREAGGDILNVYGFRAEESPARAKKKPWVKNARFSSQTRTVIDWLPIHDWTESQVWDSIRASGVPYHNAYDLGMPRLSCMFCIFAPKAALMIAGRANPALLDEYVAVEDEIGHTFRHHFPIRSVRESIAAGEVPEKVDGKWNM